MGARIHPGVSSYLSVNWQNPINWQHGLNRGLVDWWLNVPHWQGGTTWRSLVRNHGTLTNMVPASDWVRSDRPGGWGALRFSGADDRVDTNLSTHFTRTTISAWFKLNAFGTPDDRILDKLAAIEVNIPQSVGTRRIVFTRIFSVTEGGWETPVDSIVAGVWIHVVVTYDDSDVANNPTIYLDTISQALNEASTPEGTANDNANNYMIGNRQTGSRVFNGPIDDVRIYNRLLSSTEVAQLYQLGRQGYPGVLNRISRSVNTAAIVVARRIFIIS